MKTTDLIPIILYQLIDGDRYGYEIIKQVEDISNGNIVIKQPILYSILKKLEQGRFITSYWQDSEIGGKRHYYKLTENGRAQLSTYPPLQTLINEALAEDDSVAPFNTSTIQYQIKTETDTIDVNSTIETFEIPNNDDIKPIPIDLSSPTGLKNDGEYHLPQQSIVEIDLSSPISSVTEDQPTIDKSTNSTPPINIFDAIEPETTTPTSTSTSIFDAIEPEVKVDNVFDAIEVANDSSNIAMDSKEEVAIHEDVTTELDNTKLTLDQNIFQSNFEDILPTIDIEKVSYLNYVDFSKDNETIKRRKAITKHIQKMTLTTASLLLLLILSIVICSKYEFSKLYYISAIIAIAVIILYPINLLTKLSKIRLKYCSYPFKYSLSRDFFVKLSLFLSLVIVVFAYNISSATTIAEIFKMDNFANFLAPIMLGATLMLDFAFSAILYKKYLDK